LHGCSLVYAAYIVSQTIGVPRETKEALLRFAARLQESTGRRVDFDAAIARLVMKKDKDPNAFARFVGSVSGVGPEEMLDTLAEGRRLDEPRAKRKYGS
jgi:hypothetical protein